MVSAELALQAILGTLGFQGTTDRCLGVSLYMSHLAFVLDRDDLKAMLLIIEAKLSTNLAVPLV